MPFQKAWFSPSSSTRTGTPTKTSWSCRYCSWRDEESLTLTDHPHWHEQWNWDAEGRYGEYDSDDNDDPCARTTTVSQALENLDRELLPDLRTIVLAWHPEDDEMDDDLKQKIENMGVSHYVWIHHPRTGEIRCWINNLPEPWSSAGTNRSIIGSGVGVGPAKTIYIADMNGDGMEDYLVVDPSKGSVRVWWNYGPDNDWFNSWKFVEGGAIASGVPHANLHTLRFLDINGDGRADYVYIGQGGALKHHLNTGSVGGQDVLFHAQGGIATGAVDDISKLIFADATSMNGDGRDDYPIWDDDSGLTGFLNQRTNKEGVPLYIDHADGIHQPPDLIRLADMDGDGKDDYIFVGEYGALYVWYSRGTIQDFHVVNPNNSEGTVKNY